MAMDATDMLFGGKTPGNHKSVQNRAAKEYLPWHNAGTTRRK